MIRTKQIEVVPYNPEWPVMFAEESARIMGALGNNCIMIHHIGSTSVPGLAAKPIIDIIVVVKNAKAFMSSVESIGYAYKGEMNIPFRFYFSKKGAVTVHLHVYEDGNPEIELNLTFTNYLRNNPQACAEYAALKTHLLTQVSSFERSPSQFSGYTLGKHEFIRGVYQKAGFNGTRLMHCTHDYEWETAKAFRKRFFDKFSMLNPHTGTFNHPDHVHFVFSSGVDIVGYAHIQKWLDDRAALRMMVIDEKMRRQGFGTEFLKLCERWLKGQGIKTLHAESSPEAQPFYMKYGYVEILFNDPDGYEVCRQDIPLGKVL
ncbi:MAG: bifunctional GrpB family protein/GNAT family N-acetyltransferase [Pseudomonadota bacterium]